jgi:hypothetical protein
MNECGLKGIINREMNDLKDINEYRLPELKQDGPSLSWIYALTNEVRTSVVNRRTSSRISEAICRVELEEIKAGEGI